MNIITAIREEMLVPIHPAGWPFIGLFAVVTLLIGVAFEPFFWIGVPATLWCVYFFRNPPRVTPSDALAVIAPADGRILDTGLSDMPPELDLPDGEWRCISIFMNVFDDIVLTWGRVPKDLDSYVITPWPRESECKSGMVSKGRIYCSN